MKISIVTPVYNGEKYIEETILSVLTQEGDFDIEYIIMDGGSNDSTVTIAKKYENQLSSHNYPIKCNSISMSVVSEKDTGMYNAIEKGFNLATGDIYAWINSDDTYAPNAFSAISKTFESFPEIKWLKGITSFIDEGNAIAPGRCYLYNQKWIKMGIYGRNAYFIQQDSVFWKPELWEKGGFKNTTLKYAGDYWLWISFAQFEPLWTINKEISFFRSHKNQITNDMGKYRKEQDLIKKPTGFLQKKIRLFFWIQTHISKNHTFNPLHVLYKLLFTKRNKDYIELIDNKPEITIAPSYIIL